MDPTRWEFDVYWHWDQAEGVALRCLSCTGIGQYEIIGETLARVIELATDHDRTIHHR